MTRHVGRRIAQALGILGGLAIAAWAMRDRLVSIAVPKEPEPPKFRPAPTDVVVTPMTESEDDAKDLTSIKGIGPAFADRLTQAGISNSNDLASASAADVAAAATVSEERASNWIASARGL